MVRERNICKPVIIMQGEQGFEGSKLESTYTFGKLKVQSSSQVIILLRLRLLICAMGITEKKGGAPTRAWP